MKISTLSYRIRCMPLIASCLLAPFILLWGLGSASLADVVYVYDVQNRELLMGEQQSEMKIGYSPETMVIDTTTRYTGGWMQRLFGEVKEERSTTVILLDQDQVREIHWPKWTVTVLPLEKLSDVAWLENKAAGEMGVQEALVDRYQVAEPQISVIRHPELEVINGYKCRRVDAVVRLETRDLKNKALSVTHIKQEIWVTEDAPGLADQRSVHEQLAQRMGIDAERLGGLSYILRYWKGSDESIKDLVSQTKGIFIKSHLTVDAEYTTGIETAKPKTITKRLKEESSGLKEVRVEELDRSTFDVPDKFKTVVIE